MDAAIHTHTSERVVDMTRVTNQHYSSIIKALSYSLIHRIEGLVADAVITLNFVQVLQTLLHKLFR